MLIEERIYALYLPYSDAGAAIDAARVLATVTGTAHTLHLCLDGKRRWHVLSVNDNPREDWSATGGVYAPGDVRSGMSMDPALCPERAAERGILPMVALETLAAEYRRFVVGGPARTFHE